MHILITGGTGFIGRPLCASLVKQGHSLTILSRRPHLVAELCSTAVNAIASLEELSEQIHFDAMINLAGEGIADKRWSDKRKQQLLDSRIKTTGQLLKLISRMKQKPTLLISGSAIGFYGDRGDEFLNESSPASAAGDFAQQLCLEWEGVAREASDYGVHVCILRIGLVIGQGGGFLHRMLLPFQFGLGGRIGNGQQWMSWIHRNDLIRMIEMLLNSSHLTGVFNATAPIPVTNKEFTRIFAKVLKRPACIPVPAITLKIGMGEMALLLLGGQRVIAQRFLDHGFKFEFEHLQSALSDVL